MRVERQLAVEQAEADHLVDGIVASNIFPGGVKLAIQIENGCCVQSAGLLEGFLKTARRRSGSVISISGFTVIRCWTGGESC